MPNKFIFAKNALGIIKQYEVGIVKAEKNGVFSILFLGCNKIIKCKNVDFEFLDVKKTGDNFQKKVCNVCHKLLDTTSFDKNQNGKDNRTVRRPSCHECRIKIDGVSVAASDKRIWDAKKLNYEPFTCPICQKTTIPGLTSKVVIDHDHKDGRVRAHICDSCNTGLGRFKDDIALLESAINYLKTS